MVAGTVNYLDRSALSIGNSAIRADLHLSDTQMGLLLSVFALAYGVAQLPVGILIDRFGPRRILGGGLMLWSLAQTASGFVGGLGQFIAARTVLGIGESPIVPGRNQGVHQLVSARRALLADRPVQCLLGAGSHHCARTAHPAAARLWLASDVHPDRHRRRRHRCAVGNSCIGTRRMPGWRRRSFRRSGPGTTRLPPGMPRVAGRSCSASPPPGAWRSASSA